MFEEQEPDIVYRRLDSGIIAIIPPTEEFCDSESVTTENPDEFEGMEITNTSDTTVLR